MRSKFHQNRRAQELRKMSETWQFYCRETKNSIKYFKVSSSGFLLGLKSLEIISNSSPFSCHEIFPNRGKQMVFKPLIVNELLQLFIIWGHSLPTNEHIWSIIFSPFSFHNYHWHWLSLNVFGIVFFRRFC